MKIIAIEGLDKAGKYGASKILQKGFARRNYKVEVLSFPHYDSITGNVIRNFLLNNLEIDELAFELIHLSNKAEFQSKIKEFEDKGVDIVLIDRYVLSQLAYGDSLIGDDKMYEIVSRAITYKPDYTIFLDVTPENSMSRSPKHSEFNDRYECDNVFLKKVARKYDLLLRSKDKKDVHGKVYKVDANKPLTDVNKKIRGIMGDISKDIANENKPSFHKFRFLQRADD